jgi:hypothetical protein
MEPEPEPQEPKLFPLADWNWSRKALRGLELEPQSVTFLVPYPVTEPDLDPDPK